MNFSDLVTKVVNDTNRPDMDSSQGGDGQIQDKIINSTLYLHTLDYFYKDIQKTQIVFDAPAYIQQLETQVFPRYRALAYARKDDPTMAVYQQNPSILPPLFNSFGAVNFAQSMPMFKEIKPDKIFDIYGYESERLDVMYQAGDLINFKSSSNFQFLLFAYYAFPNVDISNDGANFDSWIARDFPFAIIYHAASAIFSSTGKQEVARKYDGPGGHVPTWINNLLISNISMTGR